MFTGIIEDVGVLDEVISDGGNLHFRISSRLAGTLRPDQSVAHNGVCLTIVTAGDSSFEVTAIAETLAKTTLGSWGPGSRINLERALRLGDRLDGHFVQGHVDATAECIGVTDHDGSRQYRFRFPESFTAHVVEKGSICLDGISLTVFDVGKDTFTVAVIPYTAEHTNIAGLQPGSRVNLEFDFLGKYILRQAEKWR